MDFFSFWLFLFVLGLSLALPLGPVNLEMIKQALFEKNHKIGFLLAFFTGLGAMSGDFLLAFTILTLGATLLTNIINNYAIKTLLFGFNVFLLGYLGLSTFTKSFNTNSELKIDFDISVTGSIISRIKKRLATGLVIVLSSPWSYLWWASFGSYILFGDFNSFELLPRLLIVLCFLSGVFIWIISFPSLLTLSKRFASEGFLNFITKTSSLILLVYAANFLLETLTYLRLWLF